MLQATARLEDKGQGDKYRRKELLKKCMSMLRETGSHDVLVDRCCAILQNDDGLKRRLGDVLRGLKVTRGESLTHEQRAAAKKAVSDELWRIMVSEEAGQSFQREVRVAMRLEGKGDTVKPEVASAPGPALLKRE
ncbi:hypothetical protein HKI87_03g19580 [Chloropicon roscoffensis]|uniref:Uncharacterized protein n=2 Tax=Chloropicon roscoffensis TaxID=1461544 RepID=A0AAX4P3C9_9CHLO